MERYPVAGRLLEQPLLLGYTLRDLEVAALPAILLVLGGIIGLPVPAWILFVGVGIVLAVGVLWRTPDAQTPREWVLGALRHTLGPDAYVWQPLEREYGAGRTLDVVRTAPTGDGGDESPAPVTSAAVTAARSGGSPTAPPGDTASRSRPQEPTEHSTVREQPIFTRVRRLDGEGTTAAPVAGPAVDGTAPRAREAGDSTGLPSGGRDRELRPDGGERASGESESAAEAETVPDPDHESSPGPAAEDATSAGPTSGDRRSDAGAVAPDGEDDAAVAPDEHVTADTAASRGGPDDASGRASSGTGTEAVTDTGEPTAGTPTQERAAEPGPGPAQSRERSTADVAQFFHRLTRESTLAQDQLAFDYVRDDGIIVVKEDSYAGLVRIEPVNWLAREDEQKQSIIDSFAAGLLGLEYPFQLLALPKPFDLEDHLGAVAATRETVADRVDAGRRAPPPPLLAAGRDVYQEWLGQTLDARAIKIREFYAVVRVDAAHLEAAVEPSRSRQRLGRLGRVLRPLGRLAGGLRGRLGGLTGRHEVGGDTETRCIEEVRQRQTEVAGALAQTGAGTEEITERSSALDVLYRYYNHEASGLSEYTHDEYRRLLPELRE